MTATNQPQSGGTTMHASNVVDLDDRPKQYMPTPGPTLARWLAQWPTIPALSVEGAA